MTQIPQETDLKTDRSRLRRAHEKGAYDRDSLYAVLEAMPMCHIGYQIDGKPSVLPRLQWREGDKPAQTSENGTQIWYLDGLMGRANDQPAIVTGNMKKWYKRGVLHRAGAPALIHDMTGREEWYWHNLSHRIDGPAVTLKYSGMVSITWRLKGKYYYTMSDYLVALERDFNVSMDEIVRIKLTYA